MATETLRVYRSMKRVFWWVADRALAALNATAGALWRSTIRPYSESIEVHGRLLRFFLRFHHFDRFGTHCVLGRRVRFWGPVRLFIGSHCVKRTGINRDAPEIATRVAAEERMRLRRSTRLTTPALSLWSSS